MSGSAKLKSLAGDTEDSSSWGVYTRSRPSGTLTPNSIHKIVTPVKINPPAESPMEKIFFIIFYFIRVMSFTILIRTEITLITQRVYL